MLDGTTHGRIEEQPLLYRIPILFFEKRCARAIIDCSELRLYKKSYQKNKIHNTNGTTKAKGLKAAIDMISFS